MTMSDFPAIHDWHLEEVLRDLGLWELLEAGNAKCRVCERSITVEDLGGLFVERKEYSFVCDRPECLMSAKGGSS